MRLTVNVCLCLIVINLKVYAEETEDESDAVVIEAGMRVLIATL